MLLDKFDKRIFNQNSNPVDTEGAILQESTITGFVWTQKANMYYFENFTVTLEFQQMVIWNDILNC